MCEPEAVSEREDVEKPVKRIKTGKARLVWNYEHSDYEDHGSHKFGADGVEFTLYVVDGPYDDETSLCLHRSSNELTKVVYKLSVTHDDGFLFEESGLFLLDYAGESPHFTVPTVLQEEKHPLIILEVKYRIIGCADDFDQHQQREIVAFCSKNENLDMLQKAIFTDCVIKVQDKEIRAHRCVLSIHSAVFMAMFSHDGTKEKESGIIEIKDFEFSAVEAMLEFIYSGNIQKVNHDAENVLLLANKYNLEDLKDYCIECLSKNIQRDDVCRLAVIADDCCSDELMKSCAEALFRNPELLEAEDWQRVGVSSPGVMPKLFTCFCKILVAPDAENMVNQAV